jgi:hypothetical protein
MEEIQPSGIRHTLKHAITVLVFGLLWLISAILAFLAMFAIREVFLWGVVELLYRDSPNRASQTAGIVNASHYCLALVLGIVGLAAVIGGSEYAFRRAGKPGSLRVLLLIIAVECAIVLPVALAFWVN